MKTRQKVLFNIIANKKNVNINELANDFAVSSRTIRNDYKIIKDYLNNFSPKQCLNLCNNTITLLLSDDELKIIKKSIKTGDYYLYKLSPLERRIIIISELAYNNDYVTTELLAEKMCVSRGTINKDLVQIKKWCNENSVQLDTKKANGLKFNVSEKKRRSIIAKLIRECNELNNSDSLSHEVDICNKFFKNINLQEIKDLVVDAENRYELVLPDVVFEALTIHIALSIQRSLQHINVSPDSDILNVDINSIEYKMSKYIISKVEGTFSIKMPDVEIYYIALHISEKIRLKNMEEAKEKWLDEQIITTELIKQVGDYTGYKFDNDFKLYDGLYNHLSATVFRPRIDADIKNPFKDQMIHEYPKIYEAIKFNIEELQYFAKAKLSDDEIAYIILHFAASIERNKVIEKNRIARVIIVCSTGIGTARIVESRVLEYFKLNIIKVLALHQLKKLSSYINVDFILTTVPLKAEIPVIQVSPLINEDEIQKISDLLINLGFRNYFTEDFDHRNGNLAKQVKLLLENSTSDLELKNNLEKLLNNHKENINLQNEQNDLKRGMVLMLSDVLREEYISLNDDSKTWEEAVEHAGEKLLENNIITREYISETIKNVKENGPYIVITKGVAIPHANNKLGVTKTSISLVRLNKGVNFGNAQNDPVKYVFMLATVDATSHIQALTELVTLLAKKEFYQAINSATSQKEVVNYIKEFEKKEEVKK